MFQDKKPKERMKFNLTKMFKGNNKENIEVEIVEEIKEEQSIPKKNNKIKKDEVMKMNEETISKLDMVIGNDQNNLNQTQNIVNDNDTIISKKQDGLIERTNSSKKILVEGDNRELLKG